MDETWVTQDVFVCSPLANVPDAVQKAGLSQEAVDVAGPLAPHHCKGGLVHSQ